MRRMALLLISSVSLSPCSLCSQRFKSNAGGPAIPLDTWGGMFEPPAYSAGAVASAPVSGASPVRSRASSAFAACLWRAHMSA